MGNEQGRNEFNSRADALMYPSVCQDLNKVSDGKINWVAFSTTNCSYCERPSKYESSAAALCLFHADEYLTGRVKIYQAGKVNMPSKFEVIDPPYRDIKETNTKDLSRIKTIEEPSLSDGENTTLCILSEDGTVGILKTTPGMTLADFVQQMKKMDEAKPKINSVKDAIPKSNIELVGDEPKKESTEPQKKSTEQINTHMNTLKHTCHQSMIVLDWHQIVEKCYICKCDLLAFQRDNWIFPYVPIKNMVQYETEEGTTKTCFDCAKASKDWHPNIKCDKCMF